MANSLLYIFQSCLTLVLGFYFSWNILRFSLWQLLISTILSLALFCIVYKIHVPKASQSRVDAILGSDNSDSDAKDIEVVRIVAHRACGLDAPENSLGALNKVIRDGVKAVEFDVALSKDNIPVVFHDDTLTRMTGDTRHVKSVSYADLTQMDISDKDPRGKYFPGEKIPSFDSFVSRCMEKNIRMFIDLKGSEKRMAAVMNETFQRHAELVDLAVVSSFDPWLIYKIRAANPRILGCLAWRPYYYSHEEYSAHDGPEVPRTNNPFIHLYQKFLNNLHEWLLWNFLHYIVGLSAILLHKDMISRDVIKHWQKRGVRVFAWTVNLPSEKVYFERCLQIPYLTDTMLRS